MSAFLQLHLLTSYPPANLNRDDLGRPKTAVMGGKTRLRISSQSLKRAWRCSTIFAERLDGAIGTRTKKAAAKALAALLAGGMDAARATAIATKIANQLGKAKEGADTEQLVHLGPGELAGIEELARRLAAEDREPSDEELTPFQRDPHAADIALFGRMVAANTQFNVEAACQVAHALSVHEVQVEDDYFTAVDDLNQPWEEGEDMGAAHVGETGFAAGLFYLYLCLDLGALVENLHGDRALAADAVRALVEAAARVAPHGKQNSFGSRAYASYVLAETGGDQPRSLSVAFLKPVAQTDDFLGAAIDAMTGSCDGFDRCYGKGEDVRRYTLDARTGTGTLGELLDFAAAPLESAG